MCIYTCTSMSTWGLIHSLIVTRNALMQDFTIEGEVTLHGLPHYKKHYREVIRPWNLRQDGPKV